MKKASLKAALRAFYAVERNVSIASLWDAGWTVRIGDEMNGYTHEHVFADDEFDAIAPWLLMELDRIQAHPDLTEFIIPVGKVIGRPVDPKTLEPIEVGPDWAHFAQCKACGGWMDRRDLGQVTHHEREAHRPMTDPDWERVKKEQAS